MKAQGWYYDPYGLHEERYFSDGQPTKLVSDAGMESYDLPPLGSPDGEEVLARNPPMGRWRGRAGSDSCGN